MNSFGELITLPLNSPEWMDFIQNMPNATIFHHPTWLNAISQVYGYKAFGLVLRNSTGEICAALPMAFVDSFLTGKRWISYPFSDYCFPLSRTEQDLVQFSRSIIQYCQENQIDPLEIRWNMTLHPQYQNRIEAVIHFKQLDSNIDQIALSIDRKTRQAIKQAGERGVRVEQGVSSQDLQTFYHLHEETRRKQGVPVQPWKFFEQLGKNVIDTGHGYIFLAYIEDRCIAGAIIFFFNKTVTYKFGASIQDERNLRPNQLILWRIIQWSCENNFTTLDFGKTDSENIGLRDFKRRWGAEEQPLFIHLYPVNQIMPRKVTRV